MNPWVTGKIIEQMQREARDNARRARLQREAGLRRRHATVATREPRRERLGLAVARFGFRIAGCRAESGALPGRSPPPRSKGPADRWFRRGNFDVAPLTPDRWADLEQLFGAARSVERLLVHVVAGGGQGLGGECRRRQPLGVPSHRRGRATSRAPGVRHRRSRRLGRSRTRDDYPRLNRSPKLKPVDDVPTWAVTCFYIDRRYRGSGVGGTLLAAAARHARDSGAIAVEGYPVDPGRDRVSNASAFTGVLDMFHAAGFEEIARRGGRPILRRTW